MQSVADQGEHAGIAAKSGRNSRLLLASLQLCESSADALRAGVDGWRRF
jgi:hypothetical protein